jgi:carotenoid cleavage dioxygenase
MTTNRSLEGLFAPVRVEVTVTELPVSGTIPAHLDGRYVRNGPNPIDERDPATYHWFTGEGMVHGVRLRDGKAEWYRNRYVQTPFLSNAALGDVDDETITNMANSKANTSVIGHAGRILALEEGHFPYRLDGDLGTVGPFDFDGRLTGSFTAHPKLCPVTGELLAFGYFFLEPFLTYLRVSADGALVQVEPITVGGPTMMHDFNVTEHHVIFMDLPAVFSLELAMKGEMPIHWDDDYPARLGVMPRTGTDADVRWFDIDPCYVFHPMNAYEDGDDIVIDVARLDHIWRDGGLDFPDPMLHRWTISTASGTVREEQVDDRPAEFPRVPDAHVGLRHRYGYMTAGLGEGMLGDLDAASGAILKYDRETGTQTALELGRGRMPGEAVFAPAASGAAEDDGYLMTYVYDSATDSSQFVVLDAATMDPEPIAAVDLPRIPFGFHGSWIPTSVAD